MSGGPRTFSVRGQVVEGRPCDGGDHRVVTIHTIAFSARTYSQARWWGAKLLRWRGVPFVRVSVRREPDKSGV